MAAGPVLVDLGGVLLRFEHRHRLDVLADVLGMPAERVDELLWDSGFSADCDAGRYRDAAAVRAEIRRLTGYAGSDDALDEAWCSAFEPDPDVVSLLTSRPDVRFAAFTNNGPLEEAVLPRLHPTAFAPFTDTYFCHRLVANKPEPAVYRQVGELLGAEPGRIRFADDAADNIDAARAAGWTAVLFRGVDDLAELLR